MTAALEIEPDALSLYPVVGGKWACQDVNSIFGEEQICVPKKRDQPESPQVG